MSGLAYHGLGQYERAIEDHDEAIRLNPQDARAYYVRGQIYGELGKSDEAAWDFAKAKELGYAP
jgi:Flp pilus assembly protein TadD